MGDVDFLLAIKVVFFLPLFISFFILGKTQLLFLVHVQGNIWAKEGIRSDKKLILIFF